MLITQADGIKKFNQSTEFESFKQIASQPIRSEHGSTQQNDAKWIQVKMNAI